MEDNRDDNFDFREVKDEELNNKDTSDNTSDNSTGENNDNNNNDKPEFEDVCFVCRRILRLDHGYTTGWGTRRCSWAITLCLSM